jgi:prephenate dehydrogenase
MFALRECAAFKIKPVNKKSKPTIAVIGAGLIGGSIIKGLNKTNLYSISVYDQDQKTIESIQTESCFDQLEIYSADCLSSNMKIDPPDLVFLAVPGNSFKIAQSILKLNQTVIVADCASVMNTNKIKGYIPAHPMAGKAETGWNASEASLFENAIWAIANNNVLLEKVISDLGAESVLIEAKEHNRHVADYSHSVQILASTLAKTNFERNRQGCLISGPAYKDMTRIASSNPEMWLEIILANKTNISQSLDALIEELETVREIFDNLEDPFAQNKLVQILSQAGQARKNLEATRWPEK